MQLGGRELRYAIDDALPDLARNGSDDRAIRVLVASAEELAAMAKLGKVQLREADNAFEDAMHHMVGRLKSATQAG